MRRILAWGPPLLWMALIFHESSLSDPAPAVTHLIWDKILHLGGYAVLGFLLARALRAEGWGWRAAFAGAVLLTSAYGASDEFHQLFTPMREADVRDWIADSIGAAVGAVAFAALARLRSGRSSAAQ